LTFNGTSFLSNLSSTDSRNPGPVNCIRSFGDGSYLESTSDPFVFSPGRPARRNSKERRDAGPVGCNGLLGDFVTRPIARGLDFADDLSLKAVAEGPETSKEQRSSGGPHAMNGPSAIGLGINGDNLRDHTDRDGHENPTEQLHAPPPYAPVG
jgi:hypothetical protein